MACLQAFTRGIIANWLVCLGVWMATAASSLPGKALGAWFPVTAFAAAGAEHSVANMCVGAGYHSTSCNTATNHELCCSGCTLQE